MLYSTNKKTNVSFPLYVEKGSTLSSENHSMFRIILIESGSGIIEFNSHLIIITPPALFCLNEKDNIKVKQSSNIKVRTIYFDPSIINSSFTLKKIYDMNKFNNVASMQDYFYFEPFLVRLKGQMGYFEVGSSYGEKCLKLIELLKRELSLYENVYWACRSRSYLFEIMCLIQFIYTEHKEDSPMELDGKSPILNEIILYLHTNYQTKITIDDLTKRFHMNRTTLSKIFKESMGMPIKDYLIRLRIKMSAALLRDTMLPISEIVYRVGFNDINHFGRIFKKNMEVSPSKYRKNFYL